MMHQNYTSLHDIIYHKDFPVLKEVLGENSRLRQVHSTNFITQSLDRLLKEAVYTGQKEIVELLLKHGANVNHRDNEALIVAIHMDDLQMVQLLVSYGANVFRGLLQTKKFKHPEIHEWLQRVRRTIDEKETLTHECKSSHSVVESDEKRRKKRL